MTETASTDDPSLEIMDATYRALSKYGYAEASISRIAAESEKSKSSLYYHYDSKEELLVDFLDYLLDEFEADVNAAFEGAPYEDLLALLDQLLPKNMDEEGLRLRRAMLEMRTQTPYHDEYNEKFEETDQLLLSKIETILERGIEHEKFEPVDVQRMAESVLDMTYGARERAITLEDTSIIERARARIERFFERELLPNEPT